MSKASLVARVCQLDRSLHESGLQLNLNLGLVGLHFVFEAGSSFVLTHLAVSVPPNEQHAVFCCLKPFPEVVPGRAIRPHNCRSGTQIGVYQKLTVGLTAPPDQE